MIKFHLSLILTFLAINSYLFAQCGCPGNNTDIGLTNLEEIARLNIKKPNNIYINLFYKYSMANDYFTKDINIQDGYIEELNTHFSNLKIQYRPISDLILDADGGYLIMKRQINRTPKDTITSSGLSDLTISARYTFLKFPEINLDIIAGVGAKFPIIELSERVPQNIQPSTGAYATLLFFSIRKYFTEINSGLLLSHRTDINTTDKWNYKYGNSHITSFTFLHSINEKFQIGADLRNDIRLMDTDKGEIVYDSGMYYIALSPILRYTIGDFATTAFFEYPLYQYFNHTKGQIVNKFSIILNLSYGLSI